MMVRVPGRGRIWAAAIVWTLLAAAKSPNPAEDFPVPPIPPDHPPSDQAAPVPDSDFAAPSRPTRQGTQIRPHFFNQPIYNNGQGYVRGSTIEGQQDQRSKPIPGINLNVPLQ